LSIITPSGSQYTIYTSSRINRTDTAWVPISQTLSDLNIFSEEGTYKLRITTILNIAGGGTYTKIYYDKVYLNITTPSTYMLDIEFQFSPVRVSSDYYLQINYSASGEDFEFYIYNGSAWNKKATFYQSAGTFSTYTYKLSDAEWNFGFVRVRFRDVVKTGDNTQNNLYIQFARIKYNPAGNVYLYYGSAIRTETRIVHDTLDEFTNGTIRSGVAIDAGGNITLEKVIALSDNFDAQSVGNNPDGWVVTDAPPDENILISDTTSYPSGGKSVEIWDNLTTGKDTWVGVDMYRNFTPLVFGVVEMWLYDASAAGGTFYIDLTSGGGGSADGIWAIEVRIRDGVISWTPDFSTYYNVGTYTKNTWWKLSIIFDSVHQKFDLYYNDGMISSGTYVNEVSQITTLEFDTYDTETVHAFVDNITVYAYKSSGYLISNRFSDVDYIYNVFSLWNYTMPSATSIKVYVSRDDGNTWTQVANNSVYGFTQNEPDNKIFRYKIEMSTTHAAYTPVLYNITFSFNRSRMGVIITGNTSLEGFGYSVSGGGDFDMDGYRDLLIGAPYTETSKGNIYAFYGRSTWTFQTHLYASNADITFGGEYTGDKYGYCVYGGVAHITNLTTDAYWYNEIAVCAPLWDDHGTNCGRVYLYIAKGLPYVNITWIIYNATTNAERELGYWYLGKVGRTGWWNGTLTSLTAQTVYVGEYINMTINVTSPTGQASLRVYFDSVERCSGYTFMPIGAGMARTAWVGVQKNGAFMNDYLVSFGTTDTLDIVANISAVPGYGAAAISAAVIRVINATTGVEVLSNQTLINPETTGTDYKIFKLYNVDFSTWAAGLYKIEVDAMDTNGVTDYGYRFANNKVCYIMIVK
ncbi:MAG: integrin alpha, partial [Thermoplasmata archaeon]